MLGLLSTLRYRFFLTVGILPYSLGAAIAYGTAGTFNAGVFLLGLLGVAFSLIGVEILNEHFDEADKLIEGYRPTRFCRLTLWHGAAAFAAAAAIGVSLTLLRGPFVVVLALSGFFVAYSYMAPPVRLTYRGLGEMGIFLAYGLLMPLGGYYLQTASVSVVPVFPSLISGFFILALALVNEIPDYYRDVLVGKRNLMVRMGRRRGVLLYAVFLAAGYGGMVLGTFLRFLPPISLLFVLTLPLTLRSVGMSLRCCDEFEALAVAIRSTAVLYLVVLSVLGLGFVVAQSG